MEMSKVDDWLEGIPSKATRKSYLNGLKSFENQLDIIGDFFKTSNLPEST
jgi:hypothetical protein